MPKCCQCVKKDGNLWLCLFFCTAQEVGRPHPVHHGRQPRHRQVHRPESRQRRRQRGHRRQDGASSPEAPWHYLHRRAGGCVRVCVCVHANVLTRQYDRWLFFFLLFQWRMRAGKRCHAWWTSETRNKLKTPFRKRSPSLEVGIFLYFLGRSSKVD